MQVTELNTDGLKREFKVVVGSADIQSRVAGRLDEIARTASLPGFRPGKVPMPVLKKRFGPSVMGEVLEQTVNDTSFKAMEDRGLRPAAQPKIEITSFPEGGDLEFKMAVELLPEIKPMDFKTLKLERLKAEPADDEVQKAVERLAEARRTTAKIAEDRPAKAGDVVLIDFTGKIDGVEFAGGSAKDHRLELGSNQFVPGFEEQLVGHKAGETVDVKVTFPKDYAGEAVAGKDAVFTVPIKEIHEKAPLKIDEEFAKSIGFDDLDSLKKAAAEQIGRDYARVARTRLKRELLDKLSSAHDFPVPQGMVDNEFAGIKQNVDEARKRGDNDPSIAGKSDEDIAKEFRPIAERRIRLGLLLAEIGRLNNIEVTQDEVNRALLEEARRFPGQERKVIEYFRSQPEALAQIRAPLFEEKVVDFIVEMADTTEKKVSTEELMKEPEDEPAKA